MVGERHVSPTSNERKPTLMALPTSSGLACQTPARGVGGGEHRDHTHDGRTVPSATDGILSPDGKV